MQNLREITNDIILNISHIHYKELEEQKLQLELLMNISRFLRDEEAYENNKEVLNRTVIPKEGGEKYYSDEVFNKVTNDIINVIYLLDYNDKSRLIDKAELLMNIGKFLESQTSYYHNIRTLIEFDRNKPHRM